MDPLTELTDAAKARIKTKEATAAEHYDIVRRACDADIARAHRTWGGYFDLHREELQSSIDQARLILEEAVSLCAQYVFSTHATEYSMALSDPGELRPILAKLCEAVVKQYGERTRSSVQLLEATEMEKAEGRRVGIDHGQHNSPPLPTQPISPFLDATAGSQEVPATVAEIANQVGIPISRESGELISRQAAMAESDVATWSASLSSAQSTLTTTDWEFIASAFREVEDAIERALPITPRDANERAQLLLRFTCDPKGLGLSGEQFVGITSDEWLEHFREWEQARLAAIQSKLETAPTTKSGRPQKGQTSEIHGKWVALGRPKITVAICDEIAAIFFAGELKSLKPGAANRKPIRERVRQAILRFERRPAI